MAHILVLHGPNLNLLGSREPRYYSRVTLDQINHTLSRLAEQDGHTLQARQSNAEHALIDWAQQAAVEKTDFIIINPAAFTHTSIALRDTLSAIEIAFIEVHISNIHARESFRHHSYFSDIALGVVAGLGAAGYEYAYAAANNYLAGLAKAG